MKIDSKSDLYSSISEFESLGLQKPKLNELNDSYEIENLVENLKQMLFQEYKSMRVFTDRVCNFTLIWYRHLYCEPHRLLRQA